MNAQAENTNQEIFDVEDITSEGLNSEVEEVLMLLLIERAPKLLLSW